MENYWELIDSVASNTKGSLGPFAPELVLCGTIVTILLVRIINSAKSFDLSAALALIGSLVALCILSPWNSLDGADPIQRTELFTGMLVNDGLGIAVRSALMLFVAMFVVFTWLSGIPDRENGADFYILVLGATLGMCVMVSANHLLTIFLGVEMASVPSYVLAGLLKGQRKSSEAALKYAIYGAGAAGIMLYGISLLAGVLHSAHLPTMAAQLAEGLQNHTLDDHAMVLALGGLMTMVGLAYKLSAVPFHFWAPDVFEGATAEVGAFLSIASKAAALALLVRVSFGLGFLPDIVTPDGPVAEVASVQATDAVGLFNVDDEPGKTEAPDDTHVVTPDSVADSHGEESETTADGELSAADSEPQSAVASLRPVRLFAAILIGVMAIVTCTFGNLAAYGQTNMKRLLAYSTIAQAGYMMMPVSAALLLVEFHPELASDAIAAMAVYIFVYIFMNLGGFAIVAFLRNALRSEEIADYGGLIRKSPAVVICMGIVLCSLLGLPPFAGLLGKVVIFMSLAAGYGETHHTLLLLLLIAGGVNTVISLFYYIRVLKVMAIDPLPEDRVPDTFSMASLQGAYVVAVTAPLIVIFIGWDKFYPIFEQAARSLFT